MRERLPPLAFAIGLAFLAGCGSDDAPSKPKADEPPDDIEGYVSAPRSCAYVCPIDECPEVDTPYECPAMGAWASIPHEDACGEWDGTYPEPHEGKCKATAPVGEALRRPGPGASGLLLPDGREMKPAGAEWPFSGTGMLGGTTTALTTIAGSPFVITVDTGNHDHAVRTIDTSLVGSGDPVVGFSIFNSGRHLNGGVAVVAPDQVYVATDYGVVQALTLDPVTGALTLNDDGSLLLPPSPSSNENGAWYVASIAASPDGKRLVATSVDEKLAFVFDTDPSSPTFKERVGEVDLGVRQTFQVAFDPNDPAGQLAYVSAWGDKTVVEIDVSNAAAPTVTRTFATDENPQGMAFLDARWMAVANDFGETISLIDRASGSVSQVKVEVDPGLHGLDVSSLSFDASAKRLYATLAGINAIAAYDVDMTKEPPALTPAGRLPTAWWPSGTAVMPDGSLVIINLRGHGIGPYPVASAIGEGSGDDQMHGSIQVVPTPSSSDLASGDAVVLASLAVGARPGYPTVECPAGESDFPVPQTNSEGPSPIIEHVFFIVRENKTFDALLGDIPGVEGDPSLTMKEKSEDMDKVWTNLRDLARAFTTGDNFYNLAVKSTQGHTWTTYGRPNDFDERTWSDDARPVPLSGVGTIGRPVEGSLFDWLQDSGVRYDLLGEIVGNPKSLPPDYNPIDVFYPGGPAQNITYNDLEKSCYVAGRIRVRCNTGSFSYMTLPNDHTVGVSTKNPSPEVMCAVNDEATGMLVDALSHSPLWASSLVIITEDDPQQGGDHVDYHRTPLVLVSPWIKRGYVSKTHIDVPALHKLFAHVLGLPYPNLLVKNAGLPLDMFTSTPDFTPYDYKPRAWPLECGQGATRAEQYITEGWDFAEVDEQPGLGEQVMRWMRGKQLTELSPRLKAEVDERYARKAKGLPPLDDDDD